MSSTTLHPAPLRAPRARAGFTIAELLITLLIIALLLGVLVVGIRQAIQAARRTAGTQEVAALDMAVQNYKRDFGFLPHLVKDGYAGTPGQGEDPLEEIGSGRNRRLSPNVYDLTLQEDLDFLSGLTGDPDKRYSVHSLAYYLMGALGEEVDFVEGPGAKIPAQDGSFQPMTNETYGPLFDPRNGAVVQAGEDPDEGRIELQDGNGVAYRYYRWENFRPGDADYDDNDDYRNYRVPALLGGPAAAVNDISLRDAAYAIVAAGADGVFGDEPLDVIEEALGASFADQAEASAAARADNIVRFGK